MATKRKATPPPSTNGSVRNRITAELTAENSKTKKLQVFEPDYSQIQHWARGTAPLVLNRFRPSSVEDMIRAAAEGSAAKSKRGTKNKPPVDFEKIYQESLYVDAEEGWYGLNANGIRKGMVSACRVLGIKMTEAKVSGLRAIPDGFDLTSGLPLIRVYGNPFMLQAPIKTRSGQAAIATRPMWRRWAMRVTVRFDADLFDDESMYNLLYRLGEQVGIGSGRPDGATGTGCGWGTFILCTEAEAMAYIKGGNRKVNRTRK